MLLCTTHLLMIKEEAVKNWGYTVDKASMPLFQRL